MAVHDSEVCISLVSHSRQIRGHSCSSENGVTPHLLTMNALLEHVLPHASTMDERAWMLATLDYLTAVKIK